MRRLRASSRCAPTSADASPQRVVRDVDRGLLRRSSRRRARSSREGAGRHRDQLRLPGAVAARAAGRAAGAGRGASSLLKLRELPRRGVLTVDADGAHPGAPARRRCRARRCPSTALRAGCALQRTLLQDLPTLDAAPGRARCVTAAPHVWSAPSAHHARSSSSAPTAHRTQLRSSAPPAGRCTTSISLLHERWRGWNPMIERWQFWIDRGGTFTDIVGRRPDGELQTHEAAVRQPGAVRRRGGAPASADCSASGPTRRSAATRRVREDGHDRRHQRAARAQGRAARCWSSTRGFRDALRIGYQERPRLFDRHIELPEMLYARVIEADERIGAHGDVVMPLDEAQLRASCAARSMRPAQRRRSS